MTQRLICLAIGYCFGCISVALILSKIFQNDIRTQGSGNLGTTNALRVLGLKAGLITFFGDIAKGVIPFLICRAVFPEIGEAGMMAGVYGTVGAVLGHIFPFYLKFKGGKGIATCIGSMLCVGLVFAPWIVPIFIVATFGLAGISKYISLGSILFMIMIPIFLFIVQFEMEGTIILSSVAAIILYKHKENIQRLLSGTERKFYGNSK